MGSFTGAGTRRIPVKPASGALVGLIVFSAWVDSAAARDGGRLSRLVFPLGGRFVVATGAAMVSSMWNVRFGTKRGQTVRRSHDAAARRRAFARLISLCDRNR